MGDNLCLVRLNTFLSFAGVAGIITGSMMSALGNQSGTVMTIIGWIIFIISILYQSNNFISLRNILTLIALVMIMVGSYLGKMGMAGTPKYETITRILYIGGWLILVYAMTINDSKIPSLSRLLFILPGAVAVVASSVILLKSQIDSGEVIGYGVPSLVAGWILVAIGNSISA